MKILNLLKKLKKLARSINKKFSNLNKKLKKKYKIFNKIPNKNH